MMEAAILALLAVASLVALARAKRSTDSRMSTSATESRAAAPSRSAPTSPTVTPAAAAELAQAMEDKRKVDAFAGLARAFTAKLEADEPHGWFAAVVSHGSACLGRMLEYMSDHHHLTPWMAATFDKDWPDQSDVKLDFTRSGVWTNKTCETPCPSLPGAGAAFFRAPDVQGELARHYAADLLDRADEYDFGSPSPQYVIWSAENPRGQFTPFAFDSFEAEDINISGTAAERRIGKLKYWLQHTANLYPARACAAWATDFAAHDRGKGRGLTAAAALLEPYRNGKIEPDPYYRQSWTRLADFWTRLNLWYHRAAFVVWAGEMLRCHVKGVPANPPSWWADHCACWGVGVVSAQRRIVYGTAKGLEHGDDYATVLKILRLVVRHTPIPGSPGSLGDQIVPGTMNAAGRAVYTRSLLDIPDTAGSIDPPYHVPWWRAWAIDNWARMVVKQWDISNLLNAKTIIAAEASLVSGGFASAATAVVAAGVEAFAGATVGALASKLATVALQAGWRMSQGVNPKDAWNWGDVVGRIGEACEAMGLGDKLGGVPNELWSALQTEGAAFPSVAGVDMDRVRGFLSDVRGTFVKLRDQGWPYIQQAYGGLGLSADAKTEAKASNLIR